LDRYIKGIGSYDIYVMPRLIPEGNYIDDVYQLKRYGKKLVYELDDDFTSLHPDNLVAKELLENPERIEAHLDLVRHCNAVTASTKYLGNKMKLHSNNVYVLPNCIYPGEWEKRYPRIHSGLTVGWIGSPSHISDLRLLIEPLRILAAKYPKVKFVFGGFCIPEIKQVLGDQMIGLDRVPIENYPSMVQQIDIGLAPLVDSEFNHSKSNIKFLEYTMGGAAVVASPVEPYLCINHAMNGYLARTTEDWVRYVGQLIRNRDLRGRVASEAKQWVLSNHNILKEAWRWAEAYKDIYRR
jgi:glycosyltransferase involved in cell wall biosynthesis